MNQQHLDNHRGSQAQRWQERQSQHPARHRMDLMLFQLGRAEFNRRRRHMTHPLLERTLNSFVDDITVVQSYMTLRNITYLCGIDSDAPRNHHDTCLSPMDEAMYAAHKAAAYMHDRADQEVVYAAALMYPCGVFGAVHPLAQAEIAEGRPIAEEALRHRELALEWPLNWLSQVDEELGWQMRYLLEQTDAQARVPATWWPLREAVRRSQVRIRTFW